MLYLANRTVAKAELMEQLFSPIGRIHACSYEGLAGKQFDLVINATSASLSGQLPPLADKLLASGAVCYDLAYSKKPTAFIEWANRQGAALSVDGLGMLVEQAAHAFYLWRGVMPDTELMLQQIRVAD